MEVRDAIAAAIAGRHLTSDEIALVFGSIMDGHVTPAQIGGLLIALRMKGETADEIAGAARAMRDRATPFRCPDPDRAVDTCGTGGDGSSTANVSTLAAIVTAAAGVRVAKHGNRAQSSRSGSADVLERLGIAIDAPVEIAERCLAEINIAFLFAPSFHAATRHAGGPRRELGTRTIFNLLGPLTNPARVRNQIVGVFDGSWCEPVARALGQLGARRAYVVHGEGGLDEIAVRGPTRVAEWDEVVGDVVLRQVSPADFGLAEEDPAGLAGGDPEHNAGIARRVLGGEKGAVRTAAVMESAVALTAAGATSDFRAGAEAAAAAIDSGAAETTLSRWAELSQGRYAMSLLTEILEVKVAEVAAARATHSIDELERACRSAGAPRSLIAALRRPDGEPIRAIAEFKRASPSAGPIRPDAEPEPIAREYADAGARAISVLTDRTYFAGDVSFLARVRDAVAVPVLRKDFVIDPYQVIEARAAGADAVLLIVAALGDAQLGELMAEAARVGLETLVEVHSEAEADRAVEAGAPLIGVNHRDLGTLQIDMSLTGRLRDRVPAGCVLVGESGIKTAADVARMRDAGADAILVGETLMKASSPGAALRALLEGA